MVFVDISNDETGRKHDDVNAGIRVPLLADRLVAAFVDLLILGPIVILAISPMIRSIQEHYYYGQHRILELNVLASIIFGFSLALIFLTACYFLFQRTPGDWLFKLKLNSASKTIRPSIGQSFQRAFGYLLSWLFAGIPFIEALIHPQRKIFYERMSDTFLVSESPRWDQGPHPTEVHMGKIFFAVGILLYGIFTLSLTSGWFRSQYYKAWISHYESQPFCTQISSATVKLGERLDQGISHAVFLDDADCLSQELQMVSEDQFEDLGFEDKQLFYLGQWILSDDKSLDTKYEAQVCGAPKNGSIPDQNQNEACSVGLIYKSEIAMDEMKEDSAGSLRAQELVDTLETETEKLTKSPRYLLTTNLLLMKSTLDQGNFAQSFAFWGEITKNKNLSWNLDEYLKSALALFAVQAQESLNLPLDFQEGSMAPSQTLGQNEMTNQKNIDENAHAQMAQSSPSKKTEGRSPSSVRSARNQRTLSSAVDHRDLHRMTKKDIKEILTKFNEVYQLSKSSKMKLKE